MFIHGIGLTSVRTNQFPLLLEFDKFSAKFLKRFDIYITVQALGSVWFGPEMLLLTLK